MKTRKRTPRKVLSLLLCVLMVATSVVFANPFTAKAARVNFDDSKYGKYCEYGSDGTDISGNLDYEYKANVNIGNGTVTPVAFELSAVGMAYPWGRYGFVQRISSPNPTIDGTPDLDKYSQTYNGDYGSFEASGNMGVLGADIPKGGSTTIRLSLFTFYDHRIGVSNKIPQANIPETVTASNVYAKPESNNSADFSQKPDKGEVILATLSNEASYYKTATFDSKGYLGSLKSIADIFYSGIDSTELYNLYKDLYIGYYGGFYTVTPVDTFVKAMNAADLVLQGKLDNTIMAPVSEGGYGYHCICQELINAIVADLKSVNVEVTFSNTIITSSNPADAATFNTIKTPSNYKDGLDVTVNVNTAKYNVNNPKLIVKDQYGVLGEYSLKHSSGSAYTCNVPITGDISEIVATGFTAKEYTVSIPAGAAYTRSADSIKVVHGNTGKFSIILKDAYNRASLPAGQQTQPRLFQT